ncbi:MAG TPA: methylmalonyl-CoA mutase family protein [Polyangia bacterium]|nr:methylmalonyl-CoA mutase family protein [Polyangia bacterium]
MARPGKSDDGSDANAPPAPRATGAGIPLEVVYDTASRARAGAPFDAERDLGQPGAPPYTRGIHATMYRGRPWTMRQYAGFGTAAESNERYKFLLASGQTGLSVAFDLPTQMGRDSDHPLARGEVGRSGVAISSLDDMQVLLDGLPLDRVSTSMTINATAATLLCLYVAVADERGLPRASLSGTVQNDILKEYIARGTYIYPPAPSMRLVADTFAFCRDEMPRWNTISISGYHIREAGSDAVQEVAFTLADGIAYVEAARAAGLEVDAFAPRLSFFFNAHSHLLEEVAKFRAARRLWARIMRERFGARDPRSLMLRFHAQTAGSTLTAQQPLNNVVRTTIEALAAVLGGAQSIHTNAYDEALALPTKESARVALRTQQLLAYEAGVADVVDPLGGAYALEALTNEVEARAAALIADIDARGGMVAAIEAGWPQREIERRAFEHQRAVETGARVIVGVNRFADDGEARDAGALHRLDPALEASQVQRLARFRAARDAAAARAATAALAEAARGTANLLPCILHAVKARATLGEIADALRGVFGEYRPA